MKKKYFLISAVSICAFLFWSIAICNDRDYWPTKDWRSSPPEKQGMDSKMLGNINDYATEKLLNVSSALVVRHGYIVFEEYYIGSKEDLRALLHATKSITSALIGIALKEGYLKSIDQKMIDFFPEFVSADLNPDVNKITIRHLLTMTAGFGKDFYGTINPNWIKDMLNKPLMSEPGKDFRYNATSNNILSMIITKATGMKSLDFGKKYLFQPLGISNIQWEEMYGYTYGGLGLQLTSHDMAKIGYLYLNDGRWGNKQILAPEWVEVSTHFQIKVPESQKDANEDYGFQWYVFSTGGHHSYTAWGADGQFIYVIPDLDIVTVITGFSADAGSQYLSIIDNFVIPSILK